MGRLITRDWNHRAFNNDEAFENRYKLTPRIEQSCYAIFDYGSGPLKWTDYDYERGRWWFKEESEVRGSNWLKMETDQDVRKIWNIQTAYKKTKWRWRVC